MALAHALARHWYRRDAVAWGLWPIGAALGVVAGLRRVLYRCRLIRSHRLAVPVIVVGNLVAGGSGKTPLVLWIAELLKSRGRSPAIVSRGYAGRATDPTAVTLTSDPRDVGDEPVVLARRSGCPVWVGADRVAAAAAALRADPRIDVLVLDDGLQHYRLARDIELAVVDGRGFGNGFLLPAGPLREPVSRLQGVDAIIAHGAGARARLAATGSTPVFDMVLEGGTFHCMTDARERRGPDAFAGSNVHAVAGLGEPERFFRHLATLGLEPITHPFPDHHPFTADDLEFGDGAPVMMTEKDAVKLRTVAQPNWWVLPVHAKLVPAFGDWLLARVAEWRPR